MSARDELLEALTMAANTCSDVTRLGRFSRVVDPVRWVAQLEAHLLAAIKRAEAHGKNQAAVELGRIGGLAGKGKTSKAKAAAARRNGKKGGRPRKQEK